jgi:hypothetical protein
VKHPALLAAAFLAVLGVACATPASATGWIRIQQHDNTTQKYDHVMLALSKHGLTFISADKVTTAVIHGGECSDEGQVKHCTAKSMTLVQDGVTREIPVDHATFYFNLTEQDQNLPLSTLKLAPHSVVFSMKTAKGTYVTGSGKLDKENMS